MQCAKSLRTHPNARQNIFSALRQNIDSECDNPTDAEQPVFLETGERIEGRHGASETTHGTNMDSVNARDNSLRLPRMNKEQKVIYAALAIADRVALL
ncbi:hypothetical protein PQR53_28945 [Paraburkholderia fungorum]|uniref:hypothetical protein n=1 Tax=Paraburkholderia fungorum TaxID=134537 RepID=UPI0038BBBBC3